MNQIHGVMLQKQKALLDDRNILKEVFKIAVFRGIFRTTDFCMRNIMVTEDKQLFSIDEHDIGGRKDIIGSREKLLISKINNTNIASEVLQDIMTDIPIKLELVHNNLIANCFELTNIANNYNNLKPDLINEGIEFQ